MAHSYTPGLKVAARTEIRKERRLPLKGTIQVQVGDRVVADQVVACTELPGKVFPVNAANSLGVSPDRLPEMLSVQVGDSVEREQIMGRTEGFLGLFGAELKAVTAGTVESISTVTGQLILRADPIPVEVQAYIDGEVEEVYADEGVGVRTEGSILQGIFGLGGEVLAPLRTLVEAPDRDLLPQDIPDECAGQALVGGRFASAEAVHRAVEAGASALIVGGFDYLQIKEILGYEVGVAITGSERFGLTLVVTEGFGVIPMSDAAFELLTSLEGKRASINGATQIRAGVIRPEVIVALSDEGQNEEGLPAEGDGTGSGDRVRVIRAPWFGRLGTVVGLPHEPRIIPTGAKVRVMEVRFDDGSTVMVPRANVENLERR